MKKEKGFECLGIRGQFNYIFSNYRDELVCLSANDLTKNNFLNLFGKKFLDENYSVFDEKGKFKCHDILQLQSDIIDGCVKKRIFNIENEKGFGIFEDPLNPGELIINTEDIWGTSPDFDGRRIQDKYIFNYTKNLNLSPDNEQVRKEEVLKVIEILETFNFKRDKDVNLLLGWIFMSPFSGFSRWRTHASLTGRRGTGKSTLQSLIKNLLSEFSIEFTGTSSEPGIRQAIGKSSCALLLDESEAGGERLSKVMTMLREASSGAQKALGTSDQKGNVFELRMSGLLSGIVPPSMNGADNSRFLKIELEPRDESKRNVDIFNEKLIKDIGKKIIMTLIKNFKVLNLLIEKTFNYFIESGRDSRYADTHSSVVACSFFLMNLIGEPDFPFDANDIVDYNDEDLYDYINSFDFTDEKESNAYSDEEELLRQIFITELRDDSLNKENIIHFILSYHHPKAEKSLIKSLLGRYGIRTERENDDTYIYIDCEDNQLKRLLKETRFFSGDLKAVLLRVEYSEDVRKEISIGNIRRSRRSLVKIKIDKNKYCLDDDIDNTNTNIIEEVVEVIDVFN